MITTVVGYPDAHGVRIDEQGVHFEATTSEVDPTGRVWQVTRSYNFPRYTVHRDAESLTIYKQLN